MREWWLVRKGLTRVEDNDMERGTTKFNPSPRLLWAFFCPPLPLYKFGSGCSISPFSEIDILGEYQDVVGLVENNA